MGRQNGRGEWGGREWEIGWRGTKIKNPNRYGLER